MTEHPTREQAMDAVRVLLRWAGDDPDREGLRGTPDRVVRSYREFYAGYEEDPVAYLSRTFEHVGGYDEMVCLKDIPIASHCEHHMVPFVGVAHIAYLPDQRVVGISKLARVADAFAKRLQIQEKLTAQIADTIQEVLDPKGVAVVVEATHECMTTRGVRKPGVSMVTSRLLGAFRDDSKTRREFLAMIHGGVSVLPPELVLATGNAGKLADWRALLDPRGVELRAKPEGLDPDEDGDTYEANALIKARASAAATGLPALADDCGIEVDALDGRPGMHTRRFAASLGGWQAAAADVLSRAGVGGTARYVCAVAVVWPEGRERVVRGVVEGTLVAPRGHGDSFDPVFQPLGSTATFGEMDPPTRRADDHRRRALAAWLGEGDGAAAQ